MTSISSPGSKRAPCNVYLDLTHLGRHVTGIERVAIELFERRTFEGAVLKPVRSRGIVSMILMQQVWLPLLALFNPSARFVFPGFPPSPLFVFARSRTTLYVHDLFLITRRPDLSLKARLYMAWPFKFAVSHLQHFLVNSEKTRGELVPFIRPDATAGLYRPGVRNVFDLDGKRRDARDGALAPIRIVSVGTVEPRKNYSAAAAIAARLNMLHKGGAELHIVGRDGWGPDAERLTGNAHVTVHGFLPAAQAKAVIERADVYLCTSHDEGLGLPLLEVQYAGLPVVAPDKPVFREVLGSSGTFVDPSDPDAAAAQILALVSKQGWRQRHAAEAGANVERWNSEAAADAERARHMFGEACDKRRTQNAVQTGATA